MKKEGDSILIDELKEGDETAFKKLVDAYQHKVFNVCISFVRNTGDAEDISQEVFIEIYRSIKKFRGESGLNTWIYRIAVNKSLGFLRRKKAGKRFAFFTSLFSSEGRAVIEPVDFNHPGAALEDKEKAEVLFRSIDQLSENQRVAFVLYHMEELSYQEIAGTMKLSVAAVESLLFRARKNLRKILFEFYKNS